MINKIVKMKRILVILVAAMVCAVTSCNKEEVLNSKESVITTVKFAIEGSEQTRTTAEYISGFGFKFSWNDDEQVYVIPAEVGNRAHSKFSYNADKGIFEYVTGGKLEVGKKYYAVKQGRETGIYTSWDACKAQVQGYSGAVYKSFMTLEEALEGRALQTEHDFAESNNTGHW